MLPSSKSGTTNAMAMSGAVIVALIVILIFGVSLALAHSWYPLECCSQRDCFKVSVDELVEDRNGDWLYIPRNMTFPKATVRPSQDAHFHVCIGNMEHNMGKPLCAFILQGT